MNLNEQTHRMKQMMGLLSEQKITLPLIVTGSYTAGNCDELHAFQGTGGKVIGNMNVSVGDKLQEIYKSGINPKVTNVEVKVHGMTVNWLVTIDKSNDGNAWVGFTSRGAGCNQDVKNRAVSASAGNDMPTAKSRIERTYNEQGIEIEMVNDFVYNGGNNSFRQVFYRYTKPKNNPPVGNQHKNSQMKDNKKITIKGSSLNELRDNLKSQTKGLSVDTDSAVLNVNDFTVTFNLGDEKIQNFSLIWSNVSKEELNLVYQKVSNSNPTVRYLGDIEKLEQGKETFYCILIVI